MLRLALIGCGRHSESEHALPLKRYASQNPAEISLAAVCDLDPERARHFCREFGFLQAYTDMNEMLEKEKLHACVCVMPVAKIAETGEILLKRGIPCVLEKPPGISREQVHRLADVAGASGTPHMVSVNRRFNPLLKRAIAWAREMGSMRYVRASMMRSTRTEEDFIWGTGIHAVDALRHIAGEVRDYSLRINRDKRTSATWHEIAFTFSDGCHGQLDILPTAGMGQEVYELIGDEFIARVSMPFHMETSLRCWHQGKLVVDAGVPPDEPPDVTSGSYGEVVEFVDALQRGVSPHPTIQEVLPSADICFEIASQTQASNPI